MEWRNQVAVVTGGSRGIGQATARLLAQRGAAVCVNYAVHADAAEALVAEITTAAGIAPPPFRAGLRSYQPARCFDFRKCITQMDRERTEQIAAACAVAGLARLLQRRGGGPNATRTDRLRGTLQLMRDRGQLRKVASARGDIDLSPSLDCCFTEFPQ